MQMNRKVVGVDVDRLDFEIETAMVTVVENRVMQSAVHSPMD